MEIHSSSVPSLLFRGIYCHVVEEPGKLEILVMHFNQHKDISMKKLLINRGCTMKLGNPSPRCTGALGFPFRVHRDGLLRENQTGTHLVCRLTKVWAADSGQCSSGLLREVWEALKLCREPGTRAGTGPCCGPPLALSTGHSPQKPHNQQDQPV